MSTDEHNTLTRQFQFERTAAEARTAALEATVRRLEALLAAEQKYTRHLLRAIGELQAAEQSAWGRIFAHRASVSEVDYKMYVEQRRIFLGRIQNLLEPLTS